MNSATAVGAVVGGGAKGSLLSKISGGGLKGAGAASIWGLLYEGLKTVKTNDPAQKKALQEQLGPVLFELGLTKSPDLTGGDAGNNKGTGNRDDRISNAVQALVKAGFPLASAQGIAAGLYSESGLKTNNPNPKSGANGIAQWLGPRAKEFEKQYLHPVGEGTFEEQIQFLIWELNNTEKRSGDKLRKGGLTPRGAAGEFINNVERPGPAGAASDMNTAGPLADQLGAQAAGNVDSSKTITMNNNVDVHMPPGGDVFGATKAFSGALDQSTANALRNLQAVTR